MLSANRTLLRRKIALYRITLEGTGKQKTPSTKGNQLQIPKIVSRRNSVSKIRTNGETKAQEPSILIDVSIGPT
nr:CBM_HP1_G0003810.mRNA.1.CDS.1 [Saccharomyces cerevisiae]